MSTYSTNLRIELPTDGTQAGTWGNTTNANMAFVMDSAIAGYQEVTVSAASQALTYTNGPSTTAASNQAVYALLKIASAPSAFSLYAPPNSKSYIIWNASGYTMSLRVSDVIGSTTPITGNVALSIANGNKVMVWSDGVSFYDVQAQNLTGTLAIANGGTGQVTANAALNALLPSQTSNANKYLQTDGTNSSWDAISLSTADITGTLAVANGGTGATDAATARSNLSVPSTTGTGASGTWGISISGNAATATSATTATNATNATNATDATTAQNTRYGPGSNNSNIANGNGALNSRTTGIFTTAMGAFSLYNLTSGTNNTGIGYQASFTLANGLSNTAIGSNALYWASASSFCVAVGASSLLNALGDSNVGVGINTGLSLVTGSANTLLGSQAMYFQNNANFCTAVGNNTLTTALASLSNSSAFGYEATVAGNNQIQLGNSSTTTYVYGTVQNRSDLRDKTDVRDTTLGLDFVMSLRPVDYKWDMRDFYRPAAPQPPEDTTDKQAQADFQTRLDAWRETAKLANITHDGSKKRTRYHHGFIAQEVMALNADFGGIQDHKIAGGEDVLSLGYDEMIAPLVKAIQELKAEFDAYKAAHP